MVERLLGDLADLPEIDQIILTHNLPEPAVQIPAGLAGKVEHINNPQPKGFAENHNAAFSHCRNAYYCVLNPDVRLLENPFPALCAQLARPGVALAAPMAVGADMVKQDTARHYPTPLRIAIRVLGRRRNNYAFEFGDAPLEPEWVAGMFMLLRAEDYAAVDGFDESYFMYCEDVDLCARLWQRGGKVVLVPGVRVIHDAQRSSHRNLRFLYWHVSSLIRFFLRRALGRFKPARH